MLGYLEYLNEMALPLAKARQRFEATKYQILDHFLKIKMMPDDRSVVHWKKELSGFVKSLKKVKLKNTNSLVSLDQSLEWLNFKNIKDEVENIKDEYPRDFYRDVEIEDYRDFIKKEFS